jgi:hypothetical protein
VCLARRRALPLTEVIRLAARAGWPYLIVDGVNIPTERIAAEYTAKQYWYSGKHRRHGGNVQTVAAPDGELLWVSGVLPGRTVDITAARRYRIADKVLAADFRGSPTQITTTVKAIQALHHWTRDPFALTEPAI